MIVSTLRLVLSEPNHHRVLSSLAPVVEWARVQPGCRACHLFTEPDDPRTLVLLEEWDTQAALDRHLRSEQYRRVLAAMDLSEEPPEVRFDTVESRGGFEVVEAVRLPRAQ